MNGNNINFEAFFQEHFLIVVRYINKKIGDYQNAEDIAMDVFLSCYKHFEQFDETKASMKTWLYVIVNNRLKNYYRDKKEVFELNENSHKDDGFEESLIFLDSVKKLRMHLARAIKTLPELHRRIIINKYFGDKTSVQLAEMYHLTPGNVRVILTRSLKKIQLYFMTHDIYMEV